MNVRELAGELEAVWRRFLDGVETGDGAAIDACLADDVTMVVPFMTMRDGLRGRQAVLDAFARMQAATGPGPGGRSLRITIERMDAKPLAEGVCLVESVLRFGNELGRRSVVLRREAGGWRIVHLHGSNVALPVARLPRALG